MKIGRGRGHGGDLAAVRAALPHPAGRGHADRRDHRHGRTLRPALGGDWRHILRREVRRVVSSPLDVNRYLAEFYGVRRSIQKARDAKIEGGYDASAMFNFEQLVELGSPATSAPTTVTWCASSTGCCSTRWTSAPRHPPRTTSRQRQHPLPHRRVMHPGVLRDAAAGHDRGDRAHQDPGPHGRGGEAPPAGRPHQDP